ncbi:MAG: hypothetical protein RJA70_2547 [Pseudomonadota bacterium]
MLSEGTARVVKTVAGSGQFRRDGGRPPNEELAGLVSCSANLGGGPALDRPSGRERQVEPARAEEKSAKLWGPVLFRDT